MSFYTSALRPPCLCRPHAGDALDVYLGGEGRFSRRSGLSQGGGRVASLSWAFLSLGGLVRVVGGVLASLSRAFPPSGGRFAPGASEGDGGLVSSPSTFPPSRGMVLVVGFRTPPSGCCRCRDPPS